jgi:hypothetical protein
MNIKAIAILVVSGMLIQGSCDKTETGTPACISNKIAQMQQDPVRNPPGSVTQYLYNGQTVYYITADCCDQYNELYDSKCNLICAPDGGFTGQGDGRCPDFFTNRTNEKLIWQDSR